MGRSNWARIGGLIAGLFAALFAAQRPVTAQCTQLQDRGTDLRLTTTTPPTTKPDMVWNGSSYGLVYLENGDVYFLRVNTAGAPIGSPVRVNDANAVTDTNAHVVWNGSGYGVAWLRGNEPSQQLLFARLDSSGNRIGAEVPVTTPGTRPATSLAWNGTGYGLTYGRSGAAHMFTALGATGAVTTTRVIVEAMSFGTSLGLVWNGSSYGYLFTGGETIDDTQVHLLLLDTAGNAVSVLDQLSSASNTVVVGSDFRFGSLVWTGSEFGAVWAGDAQGQPDQIYFARLDGAGAQLGSTKQVTPSVSGTSRDPFLAWSGSQYAVFWEDLWTGNYEIHYARLEADGDVIGSSWPNLSGNTADSGNPTAAWNGSGYGVVWQDNRDGNYELYFTALDCCNDADADGVSTCQNDCNDSNPNVFPGAPEVCDGLNNDCNGTTADGSSEPWLGQACDGPDNDLCAEGTRACTAGAQTCSDATGNIADVCDGADNDCNVATADGSAEPWLGQTCDGPDTDLCAEGIRICSSGAQACSDATGNSTDVCDGLNNDCNPATADGSAEPWFGQACDGPDTDLCAEGTRACTAGAQTCSDATGNSADVCDGADNDCNTATADGFAEPWLGQACDGPDTDLCAEGAHACTAGAQTCSDATGNDVDVCDGADNDCNVATADGSAEPWLGQACDGTDTDQCAEGVSVCSSGQAACTDATADDLEICDGADNDCNAEIDDGLTQDADGDGHNSLASCAAPEDCDDGNAAIWQCNTPVSDTPVTLGAGPASVTFTEILAGGDTTIVVSQCDLEQLDGLALAYPESLCADIETSAEFSGQAEVCISYDTTEVPCTCAPGPCIAAATLAMIGCDSAGICEVLQRSNPSECDGVICAWTDHFSVFAFGVLADVDADGTPDLLDNCPGVANFFQQDADLDGHGNACDCSTNDPSIHPGAVEINDGIDNQCPGDAGHGLIDEVSGALGFGEPGDPSALTWEPQPSAVLYEVGRSTEPDLSADCATVSVAETRWSDPETPPADTVYRYVVRAIAPYVGSWGSATSGAEREVCP